MTRSLLLLCLLLATGCSTTQIPVAGMRFPLGYAGAGSLHLAVQDRREAPGTDLGVRRVTMGIPRAVEVVDAAPLASALSESLTASLQAAGFQHDPSGRALTVRVRSLNCDGYFGEVSLVYDLELELAPATPEARPVLVRRQGKRVSSYGAKTRSFTSAVSEALVAILSDLLAAQRIHGAGAPALSEVVPCVGCKQPLEPHWVACPHCGKKR